MLPIENFLQENWVEEGEKYLRVMESHPNKSRIPNAECGYVHPKQMSAGRSHTIVTTVSIVESTETPNSVPLTRRCDTQVRHHLSER